MPGKPKAVKIDNPALEAFDHKLAAKKYAHKGRVYDLRTADEKTLAKLADDPSFKLITRKPKSSAAPEKKSKKR